MERPFYLNYKDMPYPDDIVNFHPTPETKDETIARLSRRVNVLTDNKVLLENTLERCVDLLEEIQLLMKGASR